MTAVSLLRTVSLAAGRRLTVRGQREPWADRPPRPVARIEPVVQVGVPWCSDACTCAVEHASELPCGNCRRDRPVGAL